MAKGKQTCKILKEIRKQIAAENDIKLVVEECTYQGDCLGTCPKCEAEVRYLERELEKRQRMGKAAILAGVSLGTLFTASACDSTSKMPASNANESDNSITQNDTIKEPLMGIFPMYRNIYSFDAETYQSLLKDKFVFPRMEHLSVVSGDMEYEHVKPGKACESLRELVEAAQEFRAPYYLEGEQNLLAALLFQSKVDLAHFEGEMEVAFTVDKTGALSDIVIQKGIDRTLDEVVTAFFETMEWEITGWRPAVYVLKDGMAMPFDCRCVQKIQFPIDIEDVEIPEGYVVPDKE